MQKGRLAQNVVHVGKVRVIGISCLYPCSLYFVVPTLNFKRAFSWPRSSLPKVKGKEFGCKTIHKPRDEGKHPFFLERPSRFSPSQNPLSLLFQGVILSNLQNHSEF